MFKRSKYHDKTTLSESELDPKLTSCPICNSEDVKMLSRIQENPLVETYECNDCFVGFMNRQPTNDYLIKYYQKYYTENYYDRTTTIKEKLLVDHLVKMINNFSREEAYDIMDFGGGDGTIAYALATQILMQESHIPNINIYVIDPNSGSLSSDNECIKVINRQSITDDLPKMNLVIASAILEHVKQPKIVFDELVKYMKKEGLFYARTPYTFPFVKALTFLPIQLDLFYPGHLFDMGVDFWNNLIDSNENLKMIKSRPSLVETTFKENFLWTAVAYIFKLPFKIFGTKYKFVGGWEVLVSKV